MENSSVKTVVHKGWAELVLNRPERKNAINGLLGLALAEQLTRLDEDDNIQVVLLRGEGGAFCSGLDLKAFNADPAPAWLADFQGIWRGAHRALFNFRKPIIGALQRYAINGGAALAFACDYLVVGETSFLQVGEIQIGMGAPYNLAWLSLRHSEATMAAIALVGDRISGPELVSKGIAQVCVAEAEVLNEATTFAERIAAYPGSGVLSIKAGLRARQTQDADSWFDQFTNIATAPLKPSAMNPPPGDTRER